MPSAKKMAYKEPKLNLFSARVLSRNLNSVRARYRVFMRRKTILNRRNYSFLIAKCIDSQGSFQDLHFIPVDTEHNASGNCRQRGRCWNWMRLQKAVDHNRNYDLNINRDEIKLSNSSGGSTLTLAIAGDGY